MPCYISFRDVQFHPSTTGVRITAITDIPCHLYCRLSTKRPWIHKKPELRRGVQFAEDVRFCFTVYEDNEQFEAGDTYTHTWWKTDWSPCITKYLYLWGSVGAQVCVSTSPLFNYHNTGEAPVPPPEAMYQLNAIDPQFYTFAGGPTWNLADLSRDIPQDATGALIQFYNSDVGFNQPLALRKPGANYDHFVDFEKDGTLWAIVGLDAERRFEYRMGTAGRLKGYLMGYTGRDVIFPDDPIDIKPAVNNVYSTFDIKATWPAAILILTDMGSFQAWNNYHSIRPDGSTKEVYRGNSRMFPFCGVPGNGKIQTKLYERDGASTQWLAYAYFKQDCSFSLNGIDYIGFTPDAWKTLDCGLIGDDVRFAFLEYRHPYTAVHLSARKQFSYFGYAGRNANHGYFITHVHHNKECEVWSGSTSDADQLLGIAETH